VSETQPVHSWWIASLAAACFVYACANDRAGGQGSESQADPSHARDASRTEDATSGGDAASSPACPAPIPIGELQNQASGPSAFGRIVGGDYGWYDTTGDSTCGVEGARVCVLETELCTTSDEAGQFVLNGLPEDTEVELSIQKPGFYSALRLAHVQSAPINLSKTRILAERDRSAALESLGLDGASGHGGLVAVALTPGEAIGTVSVPSGVKITLTPGDLEPYYSRGVLEPGGLSSDELDADLEATREGGWALFPELEPGDYAVRFERDGELCSVLIPGFGFGVDERGQIRARVRDGFNTAAIAALCP
jgi:hypothetical protein